MELELNLILK